MAGLLLINKPSDMTSHDVVAFLRKHLKIKKIGHTGTLDPNATGLLVCLLDKATKILPFIAEGDKEYEATLELGIRTTTGDIWGEVVGRGEVPILSVEKVSEVLSSFLGSQLQLPPMVSALKHQGKPLYAYARQGIEIERKKREIDIKEIELLASGENSLSFRVVCSAGTYIRTLCEDIGVALGSIATMTSLNRVRSGDFSLADAYTLEEISEGNYKLISVGIALKRMPAVEYADTAAIYNGKIIELDCDSELVLICNNAQPLAIYEKENNHYKSKRGLW